jgi:hypothetical protein
LTLVRRHVVEHPITEVPSCHGCVEGAILQLIDQLNESIAFKSVASGNLSISINLPVQLFEQLAAIREGECLFSAWKRHYLTTGYFRHARTVNLKKFTFIMA